MGLRFRRSVRLFPGVRLNFSRSGISTTIGVRGAGITLGPHGAYANVGLPGTGLSYRTRITPAPESHQNLQLPDSSQTPEIAPLPVSPPFLPTSGQPGAEQIHSGAVSAMTSPGLSELKRLINEAALRKTTLIKAVQDRTDELAEKRRKLAFAKAFIVRLFTKSRVERLTPEVQELEVKLIDTTADLEGCYVDIDFGLDDAATGTYAALCRSFDSLRACQRIWDVTDTAQTDRIKERTTATSRVTRTLVEFDFSEVDLLRSTHRSMRLRNASSFEIHLYPGFLLSKETGSDFALVEWKDLSAEHALLRFIEADTPPSDSEVIGQTWAKANKDGSPDRRFSDNHQIPIMRYAELWLRSPTGIYEAYMVSNFAKAEDFAASIAHHKDALSKISQIAPSALPATPETQEDAPLEPQTAEPQEENKVYLFDWMVLAVLLVAIASGGYWFWTSGRFLMANALTAKPAIVEVASAPPVLPEPQQPPSVYVIPKAINIRAQPTASAEVVARAAHGERLFVFQVKGRWAQVGRDKPTGWALAKLTSDSPFPVNKAAP